MKNAFEYNAVKLREYIEQKFNYLIQYIDASYEQSISSAEPFVFVMTNVGGGYAGLGHMSRTNTTLGELARGSFKLHSNTTLNVNCHLATTGSSSLELKLYLYRMSDGATWDLHQQTYSGNNTTSEAGNKNFAFDLPAIMGATDWADNVGRFFQLRADARALSSGQPCYLKFWQTYWSA
jgi:hypothetical protein